MKLIDAIKIPNLSGKPTWIPNCSRRDLPEFFKEMGFKKGVEVGVCWGENIVDYGEAGLEVWGIDPWDAHTDEDEFRKLVHVDGKYGSTVEGVEKLARMRTEKYPNIHLVKKTSWEAVKDFKDRSLDFVYIDGNHSFGHVAMDLMKWNRKVKKGGIIAGHDYYQMNPQTARRLRQIPAIVDAFSKVYDFKCFWVLGTKEEKENDGNLSFMFIKHW